MTYNDETDRNYICLIDQGTTCRHLHCTFKDMPACGHIGNHRSGYRTCLLVAGHNTPYHQNHKSRWTNEAFKTEPHVCPEIIVVEAELIRNLQGFIDDLTTAQGTPNAYETLRIILDKMEKGFRVPE